MSHTGNFEAARDCITLLGSLDDDIYTHEVSSDAGAVKASTIPFALRVLAAELNVHVGTRNLEYLVEFLLEWWW